MIDLIKVFLKILFYIGKHTCMLFNNPQIYASIKYSWLSPGPEFYTSDLLGLIVCCKEIRKE